MSNFIATRRWPCSIPSLWIRINSSYLKTQFLRFLYRVLIKRRWMLIWISFEFLFFILAILTADCEVDIIELLRGIFWLYDVWAEEGLTAQSNGPSMTQSGLYVGLESDRQPNWSPERESRKQNTCTLPRQGHRARSNQSSAQLLMEVRTGGVWRE